MADDAKQTLSGTFTGTFTGTFVASGAPAPSPSPSPAPSPSPTPPASSAESVSGTLMPPATKIVDSQGAQWSVTGGGVIQRNGVDTVSSNVALMLYHSGVVYQKNVAGGWWKWQNNGWADTFDPRVSTSTPPPGPATSPSPAPSPGTPAPLVTLQQSKNNMLQAGSNVAYWIEDNMWGTSGLSRGTYAGVNGNKYESSFGRATTVGPNGEISWRVAWKVPKGSTEVKGYHALLFGAKPGYYSDWNNPGGFEITLPDGSASKQAPSGATPGSFLPMRADGKLPPIYCSYDYRYPNGRPEGLGQLTFDIWLQDSAKQIHGFKCPPITHEIMIILDCWGNYGAHPGHRNPGWFSHDVTLDGRLWHLYFVRPFAGGWAFVCFVPTGKVDPGTLNIATLLNYMTTYKAKDGRMISSGSEYLVDIELGVESVEGVGDVQIDNFRIWK